MKTIRGALRWGCSFVLFIFIVVFGTQTFAQTDGSDTVPTVTLQATDPIAITYQPSNSNPSPQEPLGKLGVFTVFRQGNTNLTLNVYYQISGTASNGVDYAQISNWVTIPAGATSNSISILPLANRPSPSVIKTVVLQLAPSPMLNPVNFEIGVPSNAVVYIESTNLPPVPPVSIGSPTEGTLFYMPTNIEIVAEVSGLGGFPGFATNVEFFAGTNDLGGGIPGPSAGLIGTIYSLIWTNPPPGNYALTAVASDTYGKSATSAPVNIVVKSGFPAVKIVTPTDGEMFYTPTNVLMLAKVADPDNSVTNVEFFAGTKDLGAGHMVVLDPPGIGGMTGLVYLFDWQNVSPGDYPLTAVATDNNGVSTTSVAANISVLQVPPTNLPPLVRMVSPANGSIFRSPIDIPVFAYARDPDGTVVSVEFFAGSTSLGFGRQISPPTPLPASYPTNLFYLVWSNAPVGGYALRAEATDDDGANTFSDPVKTTILPPVPPPTNHPAIVSIVATDPVAVEGTNCWTWEGETNATPTWAAWPTAVCRPFTNCGPKNASFTVRRRGATNDDLAVTYATGGSASNGVDYVTLPGAVTIPAGKSAAMITLVPIDDGPPDVNKTVILTLLPDMQMNPLPGYVLGFPQRAAAIIIDNSGPHPATGMLSCGCFHLVKPGPDSAWFCIEYSTNLTDWTPVCTNQVVNGSIDFVDPDAANSSGRFYRVLPILNVP